MMFSPQYAVSQQLLADIKAITLLVQDLNRVAVTDLAMADLVAEAEVTAVFASTSIEGNPLPLTAVRRLLKSHPAHVRDSEREVLNYNAALTALHNEPDTALSAERILSIHQTVMEGLLPQHQVGHWRQHPVVVNDPSTGETVFLPPDHPQVPTLMTELLDFVARERERYDAILLAGLFHRQFMLIHPFIDGNGRTGRLATKLLLADLGLNFFRLLSFENYYNRNVTRYFAEVGGRGDFYELTVDFTAWLEYFAGGILEELQRVQKQILQHAASPATRLEAHHRQILAFIEEYGFITDRDYAKLTDRAKATRALDFRRLLELGQIERLGRGRGTHYRRPR